MAQVREIVVRAAHVVRRYGNSGLGRVLVRDTGEASAVKIENATVSASDSLMIDLRPGRFVGRFKN
jgi:hypothetical protein